ncbi:hypothetical protein THAOC_28151, partial [Thalassiosira oceanica]
RNRLVGLWAGSAKTAQSTERRPRVPQPQQVGDLLQLGEGAVEVPPRVSRRYAEPRPRHEDRHRGEAHDDHGESALEALAAERRDLRGVVEHHGHDRAVVVPEDVQSHVREAHAEVVRVVPEGGELPAAYGRAVLAHDHLFGEFSRRPDRGRGHPRQRPAPSPTGGTHLEAAYDLLADHRAQAAVVRAPGAVPPKRLDHPPVRGDVPPHAPEALRERPHHDVDVAGVDARVLAAPPAGPSHGADAVRLVEVQVRPVPLADRHDAPEVAVLPLHGVYPLDDDEYTVPPPARPGLAVNDGLPQYRVEVGGVVVTEGPYRRPRRPGSVDDRRVVQLVAHDEVAPGRDGGYDRGVRVEPHVEDDGVLLPDEPGDDLLDLAVEGRGAVLEPARPDRRREGLEAGEDAVAAGDVPVVGEAEVVVAPEVETPPDGPPVVGLAVVPPGGVRLRGPPPGPPPVPEVGQAAQQAHGLVPVEAHPLQHPYARPRPARDGTVEAVLYPVVQPPRVEVLPALEEGRVPARVVRGVHPRGGAGGGGPFGAPEVPALAEEARADVPDVSGDYQDDVAEVGRHGGEDGDVPVRVEQLAVRPVAGPLVAVGVPRPVPPAEPLHPLPDVGVRVVLGVVVRPVLPGRPPVPGQAVEERRRRPLGPVAELRAGRAGRGRRVGRRQDRRDGVRVVQVVRERRRGGGGEVRGPPGGAAAVRLLHLLRVAAVRESSLGFSRAVPRPAEAHCWVIPPRRGPRGVCRAPDGLGGASTAVSGLVNQPQAYPGLERLVLSKRDRQEWQETVVGQTLQNERDDAWQHRAVSAAAASVHPCGVLGHCIAWCHFKLETNFKPLHDLPQCLSRTASSSRPQTHRAEVSASEIPDGFTMGSSGAAGGAGGASSAAAQKQAQRQSILEQVGVSGGC